MNVSTTDKVGGTAQSSVLIRGAFLLTTFLSAFLLFQVQPLISKAILPRFGGSPALWTTCMLVFQVLLFAGYAYAHYTTKWLSRTMQAVIHVGLVIVALLTLPIHPDASWQSDGEQAPVWQIMAVLALSIGVPFFLLSSTAPLIQVWWSRIAAGSPYRLYALSNVGSLLALVSYPFLVEPTIGTSMQSTIWSATFFVVAVLILCCGIAAWNKKSVVCVPENAISSNGDEAGPTLARRFQWLLLSACGAALLIAITQHICQDVAVVPLLWVAPLALYLLTFILCFGHARWYNRWVIAILMVWPTYKCAQMYNGGLADNWWVSLLIHLAALFTSCMMCHGELARLKPAASSLTSFYLHISCGGAIGGLFVSLVAPLVFADYYEYPILMVLSWLVLLGIVFFDANSRLHRGRPIWAWVILLVLFGAYSYQYTAGKSRHLAPIISMERNFYGVLSVVLVRADPPQRRLLDLRNGLVSHGLQLVHESRADIPLNYYDRKGGLGYVMRDTQHRVPRRIGVVGLGIGTAAAYGQVGDTFRFYEINPLVVDRATRFFTFLERAENRGVEFEMVLGDARISLEGESPQQFDVLVLDAFIGDAIPVHLVTQEAFDTYLRHLTIDGIMAVHISNRYLDLVPLLCAVADYYQLDIAEVLNWSDQSRKVLSSHWILLSRKGYLDELLLDEQIKVPKPKRAIQIWTDDFSNIFTLLR